MYFIKQIHFFFHSLSHDSEEVSFSSHTVKHIHTRAHKHTHYWLQEQAKLLKMQKRNLQITHTRKCPVFNSCVRKIDPA